MWTVGLLFGSLFSVAIGAPSHGSRRLQYGPQDPSCTTYGPHCRTQWYENFDIYDDADKVWPRTGRVVEYYFTVSNTTCDPDGSGQQQCQIVNNQFPGPLIEANWGDTVKVVLYNDLQNNATGIHWHGIPQKYTYLEDGVPGVTECPLGPGHSRVYEWVATMYGTSWYHSHYTKQYGAGLIGPIVIHGPASANYDYDLGPLMLTDYYNATTWNIEPLNAIRGATGGFPISPDNVLLNGEARDGRGGGEYHQIKVEAGKKYRLRLTNAASGTAFRFSIDNHTMTIISSDMVPVEPKEVDSVALVIGQRQDVIFTANRGVSSYWLRATPQGSGCGLTTLRMGIGILTYCNATETIPSLPEPTYNATGPGDCSPLQDLSPVWSSHIPKEEFLSTYRVLAIDSITPSPNNSIPDYILWSFNSLAGIDVNWDRPLAQYIAEGNTTYPTSLAVNNLNNRPGQWISSSFSLGMGAFNATRDFDSLDFVHPRRRDTENLSGDDFMEIGSWFAMAFETINPGAWLLHCHNGAHMAEGQGVLLIESLRQTDGLTQTGMQQCRDFSNYYTDAIYKKDDSGL